VQFFAPCWKKPNWPRRTQNGCVEARTVWIIAAASSKVDPVSGRKPYRRQM
jgi:hypothetical protein